MATKVISAILAILFSVSFMSSRPFQFLFLFLVTAIIYFLFNYFYLFFVASNTTLLNATHSTASQLCSNGTNNEAASLTAVESFFYRDIKLLSNNSGLHFLWRYISGNRSLD